MTGPRPTRGWVLSDPRRGRNPESVVGNWATGGTELPARPDYYSAASATSHPAAAPSSSVAFNWWRAAPGEEEDSDDDNDEDMQGPGPAVAGGRRSRCVIS